MKSVQRADPPLQAKLHIYEYTTTAFCVRPTQQEQSLPRAKLATDQRKLARREVQGQIEKHELATRRVRSGRRHAATSGLVLRPGDGGGLESDRALFAAELGHGVDFGTGQVLFDAARRHETL